jgi:two-component system, cell cycle sensor histidine kinase and response regulator CckA
MIQPPLTPSLAQAWDVFAQLPVAMYMVSSVGVVVRYNAAMEELTGYSHDEIPTSAILIERLFPDTDDYLLMRHKSEQLRARRRTFRREEARITKKGGAQSWIEFSGIDLQENGRPTDYQIVQAVDLTDARRAEEQLREWKQRYENIASAVGLIAYERDARDGTITLGGSVEGVLGYTPAELDGTIARWLELIDPAEREGVDRFYAKALREGRPFEVEYPFMHKSGRAVRLLDRGFPLAAAEGRSARIIGTLQDVTALKQMETALRESEERFRTIVQESSDVIAIYDAAGRFTYVSPSVERIFGYQPASLVGTKAFDLIHPEDLPNAQAAFQRIASDLSRGSAHPWRIRHSDGHWVHLETLGRNLLAHPLIRGIVITHRDITERIGSERQMALLREELLHSQKMEAIGRLAGGVAHDFNNLLTSIIGYADLLLRGDHADRETRESVREIEAAAYRAADLTRRLLSFSRKHVLQSRVVNLNEVAANIEKLLRRMIGEDVQLVCRAHPSLGLVRADPLQIEQVITNLAVNARDAMPDGGTLVIETENATLTADSLPGRGGVVPGRYVLLSVSDNGCGMDDTVKAHLFEPFFTTKAPGKGTGLGLATVYGIVRQSGGLLDVASAPGRGSTFRIYLPRVEEEADQADVPSSPGGEARGSETILVVEDEQSLLGLIVKTLQACGYAAVGAGSAAEALRYAADGREADIALMVTDVVMPSTRGPELAQEIRRRNPTIKVLFISGYAAGALTESWLQEAGTGFLPKPFSLKELAAKVRALLDASDTDS